MREVEEVKRDPEIIRQILLLTEADESNPMEIVQIEIDGVTDEVVSYHIELLANAGYLTAQKFTGLNRYQWRAKSLTWEGHELLGAIKDDTVWKDKKRSSRRSEDGHCQFSKVLLQKC